MKKLTIVAFSTIAALFALGFFASLRVSALTDSQLGNISANCDSLRIQLQEIQKSDARYRVYLGAEYENLLNNYMQPLAIRFVKNDLDPGIVPSIRSTFRSEKEFFARIFVEYSQSLDALIAHDCTSDPSGFYDRLEQTRAKRSEVRGSFSRLDVVLTEYRAAVLALKGNL